MIVIVQGNSDNSKIASCFTLSNPKTIFLRTTPPRHPHTHQPARNAAKWEGEEKGKELV